MAKKPVPITVVHVEWVTPSQHVFTLSNGEKITCKKWEGVNGTHTLLKEKLYKNMIPPKVEAVWAKKNMVWIKQQQKERLAALAAKTKQS